MTTEINESNKWIVEQVRLHPYSEIIIQVTVHDGQIKQIARTITERIREDK